MILIFSMIFWVILCEDPQLKTLQTEIINTQDILQMYQQKLKLLQELHRLHYPDMPLPQSSSSLKGVSNRRISEHLMLLKRVESTLTHFPPNLLLTESKILRVEDFVQIQEFMGEVLTVQESRITTLVASKVATTTLRQ